MTTPAAAPPREALRAAHQARAEARDQVERLQTAVERARAHQAEATACRDAAKQLVEDDATENAERLIAALTSGGAGRVEAADAGEKRIALASAEHARDIADRAVDTLAGDLAEAQRRLAIATGSAAAAVCAVLLDIAQCEAEAIPSAADDLDARRVDLDALGLQITQMQRGANRAAWPPWPAEIRTALSPQLRGAPRMPSQFSTPAGDSQVRHWAAIAEALSIDPEAEIP